MQHKQSLSFVRAQDIKKLHEIYAKMADACLHYLAPIQEPDFKENWFKIATTTYAEEVDNLVKDGMPLENARLVAFREAVLAAVKSENFLSLARQVPILEERLAQFEARSKS